MNNAITMPALRPGCTPATSGLGTAARYESVRIQPMADAVLALAGVSKHDATAKSGPPRGEPR